MSDREPESSGRPRAALVILDGWGLRAPADDNAVTRANAPTWRRLWEQGDYPRGKLTTHPPRPGHPGALERGGRAP